MARSAKQRQEDEDAGKHGSGKQPRVYAKLKREMQERHSPPNDAGEFAKLKSRKLGGKS